MELYRVMIFSRKWRTKYLPYETRFGFIARSVPLYKFAAALIRLRQAGWITKGQARRHLYRMRKLQQHMR